tara:strand:- start:1289 stop:2527 length:1239 start_codon:yes stop_codon:yes gene_type:complete
MRLTIKYKLFDSLLLLLLVFSTGGLLFAFHRNLFSVILFSLSVFSLLFMGKGINKSVFNTSLLSLMLFCLIICINFIYSLGTQSYIKYGFHLLNVSSCVFILTHFINNRDAVYFLKRLRWVLRLILYYSICNFLFYFLVKDNLFPITYNTDKILYTFNYIFFYNPERSAWNILGLDCVRNQGWFWEPGINQIYLNILLYLEGFVFKRNRWIISLIVVAIFSTYSTSGIIIMIILLLLIFKSSIKQNPILIFLAISVVFPFYFIAKSNVEEKLETSSFQKRYFDLIQTISIIKDYPLTGIGLDDSFFSDFRSSHFINNNLLNSFEESTNLELRAKSTNKGSSNSVTYLILATGIPISSFLLYCMFKQTLFPNRKRILMMIVFVSVFTEPLLLRPFFLILIVSGMMSFFNKFTK